jgi:hypothetical protein
VIVAAIMVLFRHPSAMGAGAEGISNACENLALIAIAFAVMAVRR